MLTHRKANIPVIFLIVLNREQIEEKTTDGDSDDEEHLTSKDPALWVDRYAPKRYTELLSDDVSYSDENKFPLPNKCLFGKFYKHIDYLFNKLWFWLYMCTFVFSHRE